MGSSPLGTSPHGRGILTPRRKYTETSNIQHRTPNVEVKTVSSGETMIVCVGQASCLSPYSDFFKSETGVTPVLRREDATVCTRKIRASAGTRFRAILQPTQPARRAVAVSGGRLMTADSENMNDGIRSRSRTSQVAICVNIKNQPAFDNNCLLPRRIPDSLRIKAASGCWIAGVA